MGTLSGQSISDTYDGLLKLADSTTGITSTYQQIQDGLGNDTNTKISTNNNSINIQLKIQHNIFYMVLKNINYIFQLHHMLHVLQHFLFLMIHHFLLILNHPHLYGLLSFFLLYMLDFYN